MADPTHMWESMQRETSNDNYIVINLRVLNCTVYIHGASFGMAAGASWQNCVEAKVRVAFLFARRFLV